MFQIKFTAVNIDNIYSTESETCAHCLCDDRWHSVRADLIRNLVTLKVDSGKLTVSVGAGSDMLLETNHELYIGGFPGKSSSIQPVRFCLLLFNDTAS